MRQRITHSAKLFEFGVNFGFCKIFNENKDVILNPQISFFQAPILEILPILVKFMTKTFARDEILIILREFFPFINPLFLPIKFNLNNNFTINSDVNLIVDNLINLNSDTQHDNSGDEIKDSRNDKNFLGKKRKKFDLIHDNLLMIGLMHHGKKNLELVQQLWVNSRSIQEIRHRIKNLTCKRAPDNVIKNWKNFCESQINKDEFVSFLKGLQWFGTKRRWGAISRYFLPYRSPEFLEK
jgi:hypothetical protein